ncbi:MAG: YkvA family protein [Janthinobacterium lividum]
MTLWKQLWRMVQMTRRVGGWKAASQLAQSAPKQIALFRLLLTDPRVPVAAKAVLVGAILFAISPLNIPQYIPIIGALDDIGIVLFAGNYFLKQVPAHVLAEHRQSVGLSDSFEAA